MTDEWDDVDIDEAFEQTDESSEGDLSLENVEGMCSQACHSLTDEY